MGSASSPFRFLEPRALTRLPLRERIVAVTGEQAHWTILDEPSPDEFEAAEEELAKPSAGVIVWRIVRLAVALLLVAALLVYFVTPFTNIFGSVPFRWMHPNTGIHTIPLAPPQKANPKLPA